MKQSSSGEPVILHVYDLADNSQLYKFGFGAYHSGVYIYGREYSFSNGGVYNTNSKEVDAPLRCELQIGEYKGGLQHFQTILNELQSQFLPGTYDLYRKNCNTFSNALCMALVNTPIPNWINRTAWWGSVIDGWTGGSLSNKTNSIQQNQNTSSSMSASNSSSKSVFTQSTGRKISDNSTPLPTDKEERRKMMAASHKK